METSRATAGTTPAVLEPDAVAERTTLDPTVERAAVDEPATLAERTAAERAASVRHGPVSALISGARTRRESDPSPDRLSWSPLAVALAGVVFGALVALTVTGILRADRSAPAGGGDVAVIPASPDARSSALLRSAAEVRETFDDLRIASTLPSPWIMSGSGTAGVIALPTSVDRSVRVRSDGATAAAACRPVPGTVGGDLHVEVDIQLGTLVAATSKVITLGSAASEAFSIGVDRNGYLIGADNRQVVGGNRLPAGTWAHVSITLHRPTSTVDWKVAGADGASLASVRTQVPPDAAQTADRVCLLSPAGTPGGSVAINNLVATG